MDTVAEPEHIELARRLRRLYTAYRRSEDLVRIGAYQKGASAELDEAIAKLPAIEEFLRQRRDEPSPFGDSVAALKRVLEGEARKGRRA
jgi:flagellar biosynthesis/type III secretory pathway ATPase